VTILPLLDRELRVRARNSAGYWTRFCAALVGFLICIFTMTVSWFPTTDAQKGAMAFQGLVVAACILCCFSGFLTVDKISRERREGTLGLLFLTRVRVLDVLLGNFGAAGIASLCALAAFVPVLLVPVLAGGVTGGEAARKVLALFNMMILSLAAGLWASASARGWLESARATALVLLLLILGPLVANLPGPLRALTAADDLSYHADSRPFWIFIAVIQGTSWLLIIWAAIRLRRAWREGDETQAKFAHANTGHEESVGFYLGPLQFKRRKSEPLANHESPLDWLLRRQKGMSSVVWATTILWLLFFGLRSWPRRGPTFSFYSYMAASLAFALLRSSLFAWVASRYFIEARRSGELELLMTTPEGARTVVVSHWKWLKKIFWWPMVAIVSSWGIIMMTNFIELRAAGFSFDYYITISITFSALNSAFGLIALFRVGMWFGWTKKSQGRAIIWTVLLTQGLPDIFSLLAQMMFSKLFRAHPSLNLVWLISPTAILLFYLYLIYWARRRFGTAHLPKPAKREPFRASQLLYRTED
jgi:hypothetical protein